MLQRVISSANLSNTIVIVTGDHGEEFYERGRLAHRGALNDEQTRVPFILSIPGQQGREIASLTSHLDVVPTLLEQLGVNVAPQACGPGRSLLSGTPSDAVLVAMSRHASATRWASVGNGGKVDFDFSAGSGFKLRAVTTLGDEPVRDFMNRPETASLWRQAAAACGELSRCYRDAGGNDAR